MKNLRFLFQSKNTYVSSRSAIIFDGDDTLWETQPIYDDVKEQFKALLERDGLNHEHALELLDKVDIRNIQKLGFTRGRFPTSLVQTYVLLCEKKGFSPSEKIKDEIYRLGDNIHDKLPLINQEVYNVLSHLSKVFELFLYTLGEMNIQKNKINKLGLDKYFTNVFIVNEKSSSQLRRIIEEAGLHVQDTWMVGNSLKSDINPALRLGMKCIWISSLSWGYDKEDQLPGTVYKVQRISEITDIVFKKSDLSI